MKLASISDAKFNIKNYLEVFTMRAINIILAVSILLGISWAGLRSPAYGDTYNKVWDSGSAISNRAFDVAVGDTDDDGKPEIIVSDYPTSGGAKIYVFENTGDNSYQLIWNSGTTLTMRCCSIDIGDQDEDGKLEIVAGEWNDPAYNAKLHVFENNGDNAYQEVWNNGSAFNGMNITALFLGDADDDGNREIIVGTGPLGSTKIRVYENTGNNAYQDVWDSGSTLSDTVREGAVGDTDGDGKKEIIVGSGGQDTQIHVFENNGDNSYTGPVWDSGGTFSNSTSANVGDQDGDGKAEIIVGAEEKVVRVFENSGDNTYTDVWNSGTMNAAVDLIATGDQDHDGNREIIVPCADGKVYVFENTVGNDYQKVWDSGSAMSSGYIHRVAAGDQDADGKFEIIATSYSDKKVYVFENPVSAYVNISADSDGNEKNNFNPEERVYGKTTGLSLTDSTYDLYVVATKTWTSEENQTIPARISGTGSDPETTIEVHSGNIQKDAGGTPEDIWVNPPASETARYDIVVDINEDGNYDPAIDLLDADIGVDYGFSLPVELSSITATTTGDGKVTLRWRTESEVNNLGFNIYRSDAKNGKYTKIGWRDGTGSSPMPHDYQFLDEQVEAGKTYFYYIEDIDIAGERDSFDIIQITVTSRLQAVIPAKFALLQNYPNPFNPETWVPYQLAKDAHVTIIIYNAKGQAVRILDLGNQKAGEYIIRSKAAKWNGREVLGEEVASGVYFYTLKAGEFSATRKMVIVK